MVSIRFTSLLLGFVLVIVGVKDSIAHTHQEGVEKANGNGFVVIGGNALPVNQELPTNDDGAAAKHKCVKARKMMVESVQSDQEMKEVANDDASKISGKDMNASDEPFGQSQRGMNDEKSSSKLKPKTLEPVENKATNHQNTPQLNSHVLEATSTKGSLDSSSRSKATASQRARNHFQTDESQKLLHDAMDTMNMLSMDYKQRPRRKPPINNAYPRHQEYEP